MKFLDELLGTPKKVFRVDSGVTRSVTQRVAYRVEGEFSRGAKKFSKATRGAMRGAYTGVKWGVRAAAGAPTRVPRVLSRFTRTDLQRFYLSVGLHFLATGMISLFIPAFLLTVAGFSFQSVVLYSAVDVLCFALFTPLGALLVRWKGAAASTLASKPFLVLGYALLSVRGLEFLAAASFGVANALFWPAFHVALGLAGSEEARGRQIGFGRMVIRVGSIVGPIVGGLLLGLGASNVVFIASSVLLFFSSIPLFFARIPLASYKGFWQSLKEADLSEKVTVFSQGVTSTGDAVFWPLFAFLVLGSFEGMGLLFSVSALASLGVAWVIGFWTDVKKRAGVLQLGLSLNVVTWIIRSIALNPFAVVLGGFVGNVGFSTMEITIMKRVYSEGVFRGDLLGRVVAREMILRFCALSVFAIALVVKDLPLLFALFAAFYAFVLFSSQLWGLVKKTRLALSVFKKL